MTDATATDHGASGAGRPVAVALQNAVADFKGLSALFLAFGGVITAYVGLQKGINLPQPWPIVGSIVPILIFVAFYLLPEWRAAAARTRLRDLGVGGQLTDPGYFRLSPYKEKDRTQFVRADGAEAAVVDWILGSDSWILYLYGQSGVGKSSLLTAAVIPSLRAATPEWVCIALRPYEDPVGAISTAFRRPELVGEPPPQGDGEALALIDAAVRHIRGQGKRLLLVIDQFEEAMILLDDEKRKPLISLLRALAKYQPADMVLLLSLRAEYLTDLIGMGLPLPTLGGNCFEVRPFTQAAARGFVERSGLQLGPALLDEVLAEAAEIEDMPDRVRPVVLNMLGLVLASFKGSLPKGVTPGRLLSGYVKRALSSSDIRECAPKVMRPLVTDVGTKRALPLASIAAQAGVNVAVARGCLIRLADSGLVRTVDGESERWETAHDFVARLVQPIIQNWSKTTWDTVRGWIAPAALLAWIGAIVLAAFALPVLEDAIALRGLAQVGLVPSGGDSKGRTFSYNGIVTPEGQLNAALSYFKRVSGRVTAINFQLAHIASFQGLPNLPDLKSIEANSSTLATFDGLPDLPALETLNVTAGEVTSLAGMPAFRNLKSLVLNAPKLATLKTLPVLPALTSLDVTNSDFAEPPVLPALTSLIVRASNAEFGTVPSMPALTSIDLWTAARFKGMPVQPRLAELKVWAKQDRLADMPYQPELKSLMLYDVLSAYRLPDWLRPARLNIKIASQKDLDRLADYKATLQQLVIAFTAPAPYDFKVVQNLQNLQEVSFDGPVALDVAALASLEHLRQVDITLSHARSWRLRPPEWFTPALRQLRAHRLDLKPFGARKGQLKIVLRERDKMYFTGLEELGDQVAWVK